MQPKDDPWQPALAISVSVARFSASRRRVGCLRAPIARIVSIDNSVQLKDASGTTYAAGGVERARLPGRFHSRRRVQPRDDCVPRQRAAADDRAEHRIRGATAAASRAARSSICSAAPFCSSRASRARSTCGRRSSTPRSKAPSSWSASRRIAPRSPCSKARWRWRTIRAV